MKLGRYLFSLIVLFSPQVNAECSPIPLSQNLQLEVGVDGELNTLRFPAIIELGSTHSFIANSIASGIDYVGFNSNALLVSLGLKRPIITWKAHK